MVQLERLCELAAEVLRDREDFERRRHLDADEDECLAFSTLIPSGVSLSEEWLVEAYVERKIYQEFGHLSVTETLREFSSSYNLDIPEPLARLGQEYGVKMLCSALAGLLPSEDVMVNPEQQPDWVETLGLADLYQQYRAAAKQDAALKCLWESRDALFDGSLIAKVSDHERLEQLVATSKRVPKGMIGELAQARLRHAKACRTVDLDLNAERRERVVHVQEAVGSYPRNAPRGHVGMLAQLRLEGSPAYKGSRHPARHLSGDKGSDFF